MGQPAVMCIVTRQLVAGQKGQGCLTRGLLREHLWERLRQFLWVQLWVQLWGCLRPHRWERPSRCTPRPTLVLTLALTLTLTLLVLTLTLTLALNLSLA